MTSLFSSAAVFGCGLLSAMILVRAFVTVLVQDYEDSPDDEA